MIPLDALFSHWRKGVCVFHGTMDWAMATKWAPMMYWRAAKSRMLFLRRTVVVAWERTEAHGTSPPLRIYDLVATLESELGIMRRGRKGLLQTLALVRARVLIGMWPCEDRLGIGAPT